MSAGQKILLELQDLTLGTPGRPILRGVSLAIAPGEFVGVVGESGSGKTMLTRALLGLLPFPVQLLSGSIAFDGHDLTDLSGREWEKIRGARIGMVFQEPMSSLNPALTIATQLAGGLKKHSNLTREEIREKCLAMLRSVGIERAEHCLASYPHQFSGGMRQRIMIASVMLLQPSLLIADEPTTALDTLTQQEVLEIMTGLTRTFGTAVLMISHNLGLVAKYARRVIVLQNGAVVEHGGVQQVLRAPAQNYTRELIAALPARAERAAPPRTAPLLSVRDLVVTHPGGRRLFGRRDSPVNAVDGVSFDVYPEETVAIVGGSGSGKTSLGRAALQLVKSTGGQIRFRGADIAAMSRSEYHRFQLACQMVFQDPYSSMDPGMTVLSIVDEPLRHVPNLSGDERLRRALQVLEEVGLAGFEKRYPHQLSGGQRQRVAIARAIVTRPALLVADEPISALDMTIQKQILLLLNRLQREHKFSILFISHDLGAVEQISDRVIVMRGGRIVEQENRDALFDHPHDSYTRALLAASPHRGLKIETDEWGSRS